MSYDENPSLCSYNFLKTGTDKN